MPRRYRRERRDRRDSGEALLVLLVIAILLLLLVMNNGRAGLPYIKLPDLPDLHLPEIPSVTIPITGLPKIEIPSVRIPVTLEPGKVIPDITIGAVDAVDLLPEAGDLVVKPLFPVATAKPVYPLPEAVAAVARNAFAAYLISSAVSIPVTMIGVSSR